jgi:hypothetical protein
MNPQLEHDEIKTILLENQRLLGENNELLHKLHRKNVRDFWIRIVWFIFVAIMPLLVYQYYIKPMYASILPTTGGMGGIDIEKVGELQELLKSL